MKKLKKKKRQISPLAVAGAILLLGLGASVLRAKILEQRTVWEDEEAARAEAEEELYTADIELSSAETALIGKVDVANSNADFADFCMGPDYDPNMETAGSRNLAVKCGSTASTKGSCVQINLAKPDTGVHSCTEPRSTRNSGGLTRATLLSDYGIDLSSVTEAGCRLEALRLRNWTKALVGPECQPGLRFNQGGGVRTVIIHDKYTGASSPRNNDITNMYKCTGGLTGRKHPVAKKGNEVINLDPGHPDKVNMYGANTGKSKLPGKGLQANLEAYQADGYKITWEEYHTAGVGGVCECRTQRTIGFQDSTGKSVYYCAKTGPAQVKLTGGTLCYKPGSTSKSSNPIQLCCPAGKTATDGVCQ